MIETHTPGLLRVVTGRDRDNPDAVGCEVHDPYGRTATVYGDDGQDTANASRIVECVNACAKLKDPTADLKLIYEALGAAEQYSRTMPVPVRDCIATALTLFRRR